MSSNLPARQETTYGLTDKEIETLNAEIVASIPNYGNPYRDAAYAARSTGAFLTDFMAPLLERVAEMHPRPMPCQICYVDMVLWSPAQRAIHWKSHGVRGWLKLRARKWLW